MSFNYKLGFVGCGNMARAIINGVVRGGIVAPSEIIASRKSGATVDELKDIRIVSDNNIVVDSSEILFLAIKPQIFRVIGSELLKNTKAKYIISMMAGISSATIRNLAPSTAKVIRIMPNTPCKIGMGVTAMQDVDIDTNDKKYIVSLLSCMGKVVLVGEDDFDAVVAVSGSGPAYVFMFIRAMIDDGVKHGLSNEASKELAINTILGASHLALTSDDINSMIDAVCSKGGTTIEAVNYYKENKLEDIIKEGMDRCYNRSKELSQE